MYFCWRYENNRYSRGRYPSIYEGCSVHVKYNALATEIIEMKIHFNSRH